MRPFSLPGGVSCVDVSQQTPTATPPPPGLLATPAATWTWTVNFGGCTFSGDKVCPFDISIGGCTGQGAPLVRSGSCPEQSGTLDLSWLYTGFGITTLPANVFQDMSQMT